MTVAPRYEEYCGVDDTGLVVPLRGKKGQSRLHWCKRDGVDRVFVEHRAFGTNRTRRGISIYPYTPEVKNKDGFDFEQGFDVLCQTALQAPFLIWEELRGVNRRGSRSLWSTGRSHSACRNRGNYEVDSKGGLVFVGNDWPCGLLPLWKSRLEETGTKKSAASSRLAVSSAVSRRRNNVAGRSLDGEVSVALAVADIFKMLKRPRRPLTGGISSRDQILKRELRKSKVVFLVHNLAFTGPLMQDSIDRLDLKKELDLAKDSSKSGLSFVVCLRGMLRRYPGKMWLDVALIESDSVATVSPGYAKEVKAVLGADEREETMRNLEVTGIMNGLDVDVWNPSTDICLPPSLKYCQKDVFSGKSRAKAFLQRKLGLTIDKDCPLFGFVGRLDSQKGVDVLLMSIFQLFTQSRCINAQFVLLGCGSGALEADLDSMKFSFPGKAVGLSKFDEQMAHEIMAASDFLLVPSRFEPCGLVALSALRYGTIPIVSPVGGLKEVLAGGLFGDPSIGIEIARSEDAHQLYTDACHLHDAIKAAVQLFGSRDDLFDRIRRAMEADVSWKKPAKEWQEYLLNQF